MEILIIHNN
jgi:hypothetical protein